MLFPTELTSFTRIYYTKTVILQLNHLMFINVYRFSPIAFSLKLNKLLPDNDDFDHFDLLFIFFFIIPIYIKYETQFFRLHPCNKKIIKNT